MVITMAVKGYAYNPRAGRSEVPREIVADLEKLQLKLDVDTVRKWLQTGTELLDQEVLDAIASAASPKR